MTLGVSLSQASVSVVLLKCSPRGFFLLIPPNFKLVLSRSRLCSQGQQGFDRMNSFCSLRFLGYLY